ncbi:MAG: DUF3240 family protein [Methylobacter sp.]|nr:DUF3240 family protein [Methylobacter sp.]
MNNNEYLVTLQVPVSLEELIVDCLLALESELGFISFPVSVHNHQHKGLSLSEQVRGRQKKIRFQLQVDEPGLFALLTQLKQDFSGAGIHYRVLPVIEHGFI